MAKRDIIVIGASAGGIGALKELVKSFPADLQASVFVVTHMPPHTPSALPDILTKAGPLEAIQPDDGAKIEKGKIYVACPDHHLLLENGQVVVKRGPKENRFRPSVDALFRSAAYVYGPRVIGIILTGALNDGTSGLWTIKRQGGLAIVQEPNEADYPDMPKNALQYVQVDYTLKVAEMGALLARLATEPAPKKTAVKKKEQDLLELEVTIATRDNAFEMGVMEYGDLTPFTCPSCHGSLVRFQEDNLMRFRCHTGHAYTASALLAEVSEVIENTLWQAMRALEENVMLLKNIGKQFGEMGQNQAAELFLKKAEETRNKARVVHESVFKTDKFSEDIRPNPENKKPAPKKER